MSRTLTDLTGCGIVFLNNYAGSGMGGGEIHLMHLVRASVGEQMRVSVVCEPDGALAVAAASAGAEVVPLAFRATLARDAFVVRGILRERRARIVHGTGFYTNIIARLAGHAGGAKVVNTVHTMADAAAAAGAPGYELTIRRLADRYTWRRADSVVCVSRAVAASLRDAGLPASEVRVIHNGIDVAAVAEAAERSPVPELPVGRPLVGCIARLEQVKGVEHFLRAADILSRGRGDARFVVVGEGPERGALESLATELGLGRRVAFTGEVTPALGVMRRLALLVLPSLSEGLPTVALEAMALGVPIVASRVGGLEEIVDPDVSGALVPPADPPALAAAMRTAIERAPDRRDTRAKLIRERAEQEFSLHSMIEGHLSVYRHLIADGNGAAAAVLGDAETGS